MDTRKTIAGVLGSGALLMGGADVAVLNEQPIERIEMIGEERVVARQVGNVVETTLPWKDQPGLTVKADLGTPSIADRVRDKRKREVITEVVEIADGGFKVDILLNERPDTNRFCYAIEGAENYDFFYQPALTPEEIAEGAERPENVVGSYAVYHKTLKNHQVGQENYATGKVMHIYRPQVWELDNEEATKEWAELSYEDGELCVTARQDFLDKANYPVRVDPTFGYTTVGGSSSNSDSTGFGTRFSVTESGTMNAISVYATISFGSIKTGIYRQSDSTLLAEGTSTVNAGGWTNHAVGGELSAQDYWLIFVQSSAATRPTPAYDTGTSSYGAGDAAFGAVTSAFPSTLGACTLNCNARWSIYATYNTPCTEGVSCTQSFVGAGSDYSWTAPTGVDEVLVACWGAGGGGGFISTSGGAGGGGGAFASSTVSVTPGNSYPISIGMGGVEDDASFAANSSFDTTVVVADGGQGASPTVATTQGIGGTTASSTGTTLFAGGSGGDGNGTNDVGGGGGGAAGPHGAGGTAADMTAGNTTGGAGGTASNGSGGAGGAASSGAGNRGDNNAFGGGGGGGANDLRGGPGGSPGGGGGGGETGGGRGGDGQCTLTYTIDTSGGGGATSTPAQSVFFFN